MSSEMARTYSFSKSLASLDMFGDGVRTTYLSILENLLMKVLTLCKIQKRFEEAKEYIMSIRVLVAEYRGRKQ